VTRPLLAFIGPSGSGKSAIVRALTDRRAISVHPTWTTRPRRDDEVAGSVEHRFVAESEFLRRRDDGFFIHAVQMFAMPYWYGLPAIQWNDGGPIDAVMVRAPLVPILRTAYPGPVIYQVEAPSDLVESRLGARRYGIEELNARLADNDRERVAGRAIARRTFRNDRALNAVVDDIERAIHEDFSEALEEAT
jgi:ribose 1,5-bisphosphokinase PhnN